MRTVIVRLFEPADGEEPDHAVDPSVQLRLQGTVERPGGEAEPFDGGDELVATVRRLAASTSPTRQARS